MPVTIDPEEVEINTLLEYSGSLADKHVLEVGAGAGRLTWRFANQARHVTALDSNADQISIAKEELPDHLRDRVTLLSMSIEEFTPSPESPGFDIVIMSWSLC